MRQRPDALILIAVYEFVMSAMFLIVACGVLPFALFLTPFDSGGFGEFVARFLFVGVALALTFGIGIASGIVGAGLLLQNEWARVGAIVLAIPALLGFPIWTVIGILIIVYLSGEEGRALFRRSRRASAVSARAYIDSAEVAGTPEAPAGDTWPEPFTQATAAPEQANAPDETGADDSSIEHLVEPVEERDGQESQRDDPTKPPPS